MSRVLISLKIDDEVLARLKKLADKGEGQGRYQTLIHEILTEYVLNPEERKKMIPVAALEKFLEKYK